MAEDSAPVWANGTPQGQPARRLARQSTTFDVAQQRAKQKALASWHGASNARKLFGWKPSEKWKSFLHGRTMKLAKFESYQMDVEESKIHFEMRALSTSEDRLKVSVATKVLILSIGVSLAIVAAGVAMGAQQTHKAMTTATRGAFETSSALAGLSYVGLRLGCLLIASLLAWWQPAAAGSGLAQVKANLNGADVPGFLSFKTLVAKTVGITLVVATGFPLGKEGPMVHIGAIVAACLSRLEVGPLRDMLELRLPAQQRAWVGIGAVAGIAAAFHAPLGGILYAFEEVCSHWSARLTWRAFVCAVVVSVTGRYIVTYSFGLLHDPSEGFVIGLSQGESVSSANFFIDGATLGCFILVSLLGGCVGALYNFIIMHMNTHRQYWKLGEKKWLRLIEVLVFGTAVFTTCFCLPLLFDCVDCPDNTPCARPSNASAADAAFAASSSAADSGSTASVSRRLAGASSGGTPDYHLEYHRYNCADPYQHNPLASLLHSGAEGLVFHLYVRVEALAHSIPTLVTALVFYFSFAVLVFGVMLPSGNFIPGMVIGALLGRVFGAVMAAAGVIPTDLIGVYAVVGSAAVLGGMTRMTLTLTTILVEATQDITLLPPIMLSLAISRGVGDLLTHSFDDMMMAVLSLPYLEEEPPRLLEVLTAQDVMSVEVVTLQEVCSVADLLRVLDSTTHNGTRDAP